MGKKNVTTSKLYAVFIVLALMFSAPIVLNTESARAATPVAATNPSLHIVDRSYNAMPDEFFGDGATLHVKITDSTKDTSDIPDRLADVEIHHALAASATTFNLRIKIDLVETGFKTGVFVGSFVVSKTWPPVIQPACSNAAVFCNPTDVDPIFYRFIGGDGVVKVANGDKIKVKLGSQEDTVTWREAADTRACVTATTPATNAAFGGTCAPGTPLASNVPQLIAGYGSVLSFKVFDSDMHTTATALDSSNDILTVFSDSDAQGEKVLMVEAKNDDAGLPVANAAGEFFIGTVQFEATKVSGNGKVAVKNGDRIFATLKDQRSALGTEKILDIPGGLSQVWTFQISSAGSISFAQSTYFNNPDNAGVFTVKPGITVIDLDQALLGGNPTGANTVSVQVRSLAAVSEAPGTVDRDTVVTLTEVGGASGRFTGVVTLLDAATANCAPPLADPETLCIRNGDRLEASYDDVSDAGSSTVTAGATLVKVGNACVQLGPTGCGTVGNPVGRLTKVDSNYNIIVVDADSNLNTGVSETISVLLQSTSDPTGIVVNLLEDQPNSARFIGQFAFTTGTSGSGKVKVADRDEVFAAYTDPRRADGTPGRILSNRVTWRAPVDGQVMLDSPVYARVGSGADYLQHAKIFVVDQDQNDPFVRDMVSVNLLRVAPARGLSVACVLESGLDTGVFMLDITFSSAGQDDGCTSGVASFNPIDGADVEPLQIDLRADYPDPVTSTGGSQPIFSGTSKFHIGATGLRRFENLASPTPSAPVERVNAMYVGGTTAFTLSSYGAAGGTITVSSTRCPGGITINVNSQFAGSVATRFTGTLSVTKSPIPASATSPCSETATSGHLLVNNGDTVTISGNSDAANNPEVRNPGNSARFVDATGNTMSTLFGTRSASTIELTSSANLDRFARDVATFSVLSIGGQTFNDVIAVETDVDSGKFRASLGFESPLVANDPAATMRIQIPVNAIDATTHYGRELYPTRVQLTAGTAVENVRWYPASDASFLTTSGFGLSGRPGMELIDDPTSGYVFGESFAGAGPEFTLGGVANAAYTIVTASVTETGISSASNTYTVCAAGGTAANCPGAAGSRTSKIPIVDVNGDGAITCGVEVIVGPSGHTCVGVNNGVVTFGGATCGALDANCRTVRYTYRAIPGGSTRYSYSHGTAANGNSKIVFGAALGSADTVKVDYRRASMPVVVTSIGGGETETLQFTLTTPASATDRGNYALSIPVETTASANNGAIRVLSTTSDHSDRIKGVYSDPLRADAAAGSATESHFRSTGGETRWFGAANGVVGFHTVDFSAASTSPFFGPFVPIQVTDIDADLTPEPDSISSTKVTVRNGASATDTVGVTLRETGARTGVFRGVARIVAGTPTPGDGEIELTGGAGTLIVTYNDDRSVSGTPTSPIPSANIAWRESKTAVLDLGTAADFAACGAGPCPVHAVGSNGAIFVQVNDADANRNDALLENILVKVTTPFDTVGESFLLTETQAASHIFRSSAIRFEQTISATPNGRVGGRDIPGALESVFVVYDDAQNDLGVRELIAPRAVYNLVDWDATNDAFVGVDRSAFDRDFYVGFDAAIPTPNPNAPYLASHLSSVVTILVTDPDRNTDESRVNIIDRTGSPLTSGRFNPATGGLAANTEVPMRLIEVGANTGVFFARLSFTNAEASVAETNSALARIAMSNLASATDRLVYNDIPNAASATGAIGVRDVPWFRNGVGVLRTDAAGYNAITQTPKVILRDADLDTTTARDSASVTVKSTRDQTGFSLSLLETSERSGIFEATFGLVDGSSDTTNKKLAVTPGDDTVTIIYADQSPAASRTRTANIQIGDNTPPITTLVTDPLAPAVTARGVFTVKPKVTFTTNENVLVTKVKINEGAVRDWDRLPIELDEGTHVVKFWSIDTANNAEADPSRTIMVDLNKPTQTPAGLIGKPIAGGKVELNWTEVAIRNDPLQFFEYVIYRDTTSTPIGNSTTARFVDTTVTDELAHTYRVAVRDRSNQEGPLSAAVSVTPDKTLPTLGVPTVTPGGFDTRARPAGIQVSVTASDAGGLRNVTAYVFGPSGSILAQVVLTGSSGTFSGTIPVTKLDQPCACKVRVVALDQALNEKSADLNFRITGPDTEKPAINAGLPSSNQLQLGDALNVAVSDNVGVSKVTYTLDNGATVTVPLSTPQTNVAFQVPASVLGVGVHKLVVSAEDNATTEAGVAAPNMETKTFDFSVVPATVPPPTGDTSGFCTTSAVALSDGSIKVSWTPGASVPANAKFQVWRAASPFTLVATINDPSQRTYTDKNTTDGKGYIYQVTWYVESALQSLSLVKGYVSDEAVVGSGRITANEDSGLPSWLWWIVGALAVAAVLAVVVIAIVRRQGRDSTSSAGSQQVLMEPPQQQEEAPQEAPMEAARGDVHRLKCPECQHRFEVVGQKPIVTHCPSCGRKGILR